MWLCYDFFDLHIHMYNIYMCNWKSVPLMTLNYMTNDFWYLSIPWNIDVCTKDVSSKRENLWLQKYHDIHPIYPVNHLDRQISKHIIDDHICLKGNNEGCVLWTEIINLFFYDFILNSSFLKCNCCRVRSIARNDYNVQSLTKIYYPKRIW